MPLSAGRRLGPYEIVAAVGAGGMGVVYRARDHKLDRDVAIKVLSETLAHDPDRLARFEREAKTLAALNHPNIAHIHGFEDSTGVPALIMELVEGPTLADWIARGPMPIDEALPIAKQIAEALEAAHEQGIVHRDLKPANIKVRTDGTVKVLDFGLAKMLDSSAAATSGPTSESPTITSPALAGMTRHGVVLGTAAYMAPEQARGKPVDKRTDIWAFGVVLYELLAGRQLFKGDTTSGTLAAVLTVEPEWEHVPLKALPLLRRCLVKDPRRRLRDIGDARFLIDEALDAPASPAVAGTSAPPGRTLERLVWMAVVVVALLAGAAGMARYAGGRQIPADEVRLEINAPPTTEPTSLPSRRMGNCSSLLPPRTARRACGSGR